MSTERSANDFRQLRRGAAEVFAAWRAELAALAREYFGGAFESDGGELQVVSRANGLVLNWTQDGQSRQIGEADRGQAAPAMRTILANAGGAAGNRRDAVLLLPASDVLRPGVRLPFAKESILRSALGYELEKLSPVSPDEVYFDFATVSRDREANTVEVALRIIRRDIVDAAIRLCKSADLSIATIRFEGDTRPADPRFFPIDRTARLRSQWRRNAVAFVCGGTLALLTALLLAAYLRGAMTLDALSDTVSEEGMRAARVEQLQQRIDRATAQLAFLGQQKRAPLFVAILADVTRTLPDGTWIGEFDMTGNKIRIEGYSHSASDLIAVFDRSGRFVNAQFAAPVTQGVQPGIERFDLTFELAGAAK